MITPKTAVKGSHWESMKLDNKFLKINSTTKKIAYNINKIIKYCYYKTRDVLLFSTKIENLKNFLLDFLQTAQIIESAVIFLYQGEAIISATDLYKSY